jgi:hypothetical protein
MAFVDGPDTAQLATEGDGQDSSEPPNRDRKLVHRKSSFP